MIDFSWNTSFQDGFNFRAEDQPLSIPVVIERFLPEAVAGSQQTLAVSVPDGEGKHAAQGPDTLITVLLVGVDDGLGITIFAEVMPTPLEGFLQFPLVLDFPIQDHQHPLIFVKNRLLTPTQVHYRQ